MGVLAHVVPKTPPRKIVPKTPPRKIVPKTPPRKKPVQTGKIPRSNISGMPRSKISQGQMGNHKKNRKKPVLTGKNRKNGKWKNGKV